MGNKLEISLTDDCLRKNTFTECMQRGKGFIQNSFWQCDEKMRFSSKCKIDSGDPLWRWHQGPKKRSCRNMPQTCVSIFPKHPISLPPLESPSFHISQRDLMLFRVKLPTTRNKRVRDKIHRVPTWWSFKWHFRYQVICLFQIHILLSTKILFDLASNSILHN